MQFRVIVVIDTAPPARCKHQSQTGPITIHCDAKLSAQRKNPDKQTKLQTCTEQYVWSASTILIIPKHWSADIIVIILATGGEGLMKIQKVFQFVSTITATASTFSLSAHFSEDHSRLCWTFVDSWRDIWAGCASYRPI